MERSLLIPALARTFRFMIYGQIVLVFLATVFPLLMMYLSRSSGKGSHLPPARGTVVIDSVLVDGKRIPALRDTTGTFTQGGTSYPAALTIASVRQVDSVFTTNLNCDFIETRDGYAVARPVQASSFGMVLPIGGRVITTLLTHGERAGMPNTEHRYNPWHHRLSLKGPVIEVTESTRYQEDMLQIKMASWQEWWAVPLPLKLVMLLTWIPVVFSILATYQFKILFESLSRRDFFSENQLRRVNYVGYYALLYVFVRLGTDLYSTLVARQYIVGLGFSEEPLFMSPVITTLSVQWAWLVTGLCVLALAQVFKYGLQLQRENELTI